MHAVRIFVRSSLHLAVRRAHAYMHELVWGQVTYVTPALVALQVRTHRKGARASGNSRVLRQHFSIGGKLCCCLRRLWRCGWGQLGIGCGLLLHLRHVPCLLWEQHVTIGQHFGAPPHSCPTKAVSEDFCRECQKIWITSPKRKIPLMRFIPSNQAPWTSQRPRHYEACFQTNIM